MKISNLSLWAGLRIECAVSNEFSPLIPTGYSCADHT